MSGLFASGRGAVISADIAVPEHDRELRFYSRVLGTGDNPLWREDDLMNNLGIPTIGLGAQTSAYQDLPLQWMPHIQVADVGSSVDRALSLGGTELIHAKDSSGQSQWAVLRDPAGAAFGLVPVTPAEAVPQIDEATRAGRIAWLDLTVPDADGVRDFYGSVVGWSVEDVKIEHNGDRYADFNMIREDGAPGAGVCHARGPNTGLPPVWMIYLPVGDLDESLRQVEAEGGKIIKSMRGGDGEYVYAAVQDPIGVSFALLQG